MEKGLIPSVDHDLSSIIPELQNLRILTGFEKQDSDAEGEASKPTYAPATRKVTLRTLLSHSSGYGYGIFEPKLSKEEAYRGVPPGITAGFLKAILEQPLLFEPGTSWAYGVGIDVAGIAVQNVTGLTLHQYMQQHLFEPLGMRVTGFRATEEIKARRADMSVRAEGQLVPSPTRFFPDDMEDDAGGAGLFSCARDYTKILSALVRSPCPLLNDQSLDLLFTPTLTAEAKQALNFTLYGKYPGNEKGAIGAMFHGGSIPDEVEVDYAMGGLVVDKGVEGGRGGAGKAINWGGLPNLLWMVDREKGVGLFYGSQLLPPGDQESGSAFSRFERAWLGGKAAEKL